jgi:hypothetical protein
MDAIAWTAIVFLDHASMGNTQETGTGRSTLTLMPRPRATYLDDAARERT